ncbi:glycosyltransferase family 2 protein [bacterium]|nr:glycosyltransferase family 2 protein [bacterium]
MKNNMNISIVIPAYNEKENIEEVISNSIEVLSAIANKYEVILVDDGSVDGTYEVAEDLVQRNPDCVRVLRHNTNQGYGAALKTGFSVVRYEYIFYTDADNQFDMFELKDFLPMMKRYDLAVGYRVKRKDSPVRIFLSWGYNWLVFFLFQIKVRDVDCAFKLFHRYVLESITIECNDFFVDTEIIAKAGKAGFRIGERGVCHFPRKRGKTTVRLSHIPETLKTVFKMRKRLNMERKTKNSKE